MAESFTFDAIAHVQCPYKQKFGIPRQPGLAKSVTADIKIHPDYSSSDLVRGLEGSSHLWLLFVFSANMEQGWKPLVRPPRLGGNKKIGVLATRSPFRPNPIGLSAVKLLNISDDKGHITLTVEGADLLDGTPIIDIKPYVPYSDQLADATYPMTEPSVKLSLPVIYSEQAQRACIAYTQKHPIPLQQQIEEILLCDPRPAYKKDTAERSYGIKIHNLDIIWRITSDAIYVDEINVA
ncbi:MAG: tRNA (N6-threonylcarbamoyladenosine(37)-N6)-methyltransferase TrmO [Pontibacterium sp.]